MVSAGHGYSAPVAGTWRRSVGSTRALLRLADVSDADACIKYIEDWRRRNVV